MTHTNDALAKFLQLEMRAAHLTATLAAASQLFVKEQNAASSTMEQAMEQVRVQAYGSCAGICGATFGLGCACFAFAVPARGQDHLERHDNFLKINNRLNCFASGRAKAAGRRRRARSIERREEREREKKAARRRCVSAGRSSQQPRGAARQRAAGCLLVAAVRARASCGSLGGAAPPPAGHGGRARAVAAGLRRERGAAAVLRVVRLGAGARERVVARP